LVATKLGITVKDGKNQKTLLSDQEEQKIIETFNRQEAVEDFSVVLSYEQIKLLKKITRLVQDNILR
jgi:type I restriction enzyme M protein